MSADYESWAASLRVVGDQAFLPSEKVPRAYHRLTDEERAHYKRDWMRRKRAGIRAENPDKYIVTYASLHSLSCTGPTRATGCRCRKVTLWRRAGE